MSPPLYNTPFNQQKRPLIEFEKYAPLGEKEKTTLNAAATRMSLSPRSYHRIIKLARTIADLDGVENIGEKLLLEAIGYREKKN